MSQRQSRRIEKSEIQSQYRSSSRPSRADSTSKPKQQWVSSTKVLGRGGESDNTGLPLPPHLSPPSDTHSLTNNTNFSTVKKSDGQGGQSSTVPGAISESKAVPKNAPFEKSLLSGSSDASTSKTLPKHTSWYRKRDAQIVPEAAVSQSQSKVSTSPLRDGLSSRAFLQLDSLRDFENGMKTSHNASERETSVSTTTSISSKQQRVLEQTQNGNPQLQSKYLKHSKSGTRQLRSKAKRNVHMNDNSSIRGETAKSSITSKQLLMQDHEQPENENPHFRPKFDLELSEGNLEHSNNETTDLQPKENLEKSKSGAPYLQPQSKRHIHIQQPKSSKPGATAPKQEEKRYVEKLNAKPPRLKAQEDLEESKDDILHPRPKVQRPQKKEDLKQCRKETPDFHPEAEREKHNTGISALPVVTSAQDVVCAVPEAPVPTSSFQQSHVFNSLGIHGPGTRTDGMTSTSFQMPVQLSSGNPFQVPQPPFVPSLQPYPLPHQGMMHYDNKFNFSPHVGHHLGSQFGINGINSNHAHNYLKKPTSGTPVKITHPETKEEIILDNSANKSHVGSSGTMAHYPVVLQPQPVAYGPSVPLNYFSHAQLKSFPFQSPTSVPFRSPQMQFRTSRSGFNSLGAHAETVETNAGHPSLASLPVLRRAGSFRGENKVPVSSRSATNDRNQATQPIYPQHVGCQLGKANNYAKGSVQKLKSVASSSPKSGGLVKDTSTGINENGITATGHHHLYATANEPRNLSQKCDFESHKLPQAETSSFVDNSDVKSSEVGECHNNALAPPKDIQQSDTILEPLPSSGSSIPGSSRLETINLEANHSSVGTCESSLAPPQVGSPAAQVGFSCTSVEVPCLLETGKDLIDTASSKHTSQNTNMNTAVGIEDVKEVICDPSGLQVDAKTEDLFEQDGTNLFDQPVPHSICKDGNPINSGHLQVNQQTKKGLVDMWNSIAERIGDALVDGSVSNSVMIKGASFSGKQSRQEVPNKAGAAGATDNPCRVYKDSDEELPSSECWGSGLVTNPRHILSISNEKNVGANRNVKGKSELGYQKGVENSNSELEISNKFEAQSYVRHAALDDVQIRGRKRYSRDFLLKLSKQLTEFPADFQFAHDMAEGLIICHKANTEHIVDHNSDSSYVPNMDGLAGSSSVHHHSHRKNGHHRWTKSPTHIATEQRFGFNGESSSFHSGQGGRKGRNLHGQVHGQYTRGTFTGVFPCPASRGGRTHKGAGVEKEFISFQSTLRSMHKAEKKYEVHKVIDAEEAKQRQLKAILNKLTPQNFDRLFQQVKEVNIDNAVTLAGLISQIFDKALMEPTFSEMYANFCHHLASELPDFVEGDEKITFKRLLLNKCQEEFERGEKEQVEADKPDRNGVVRLSEEKRIYARRRMLGNIRLIGELYKKKMLTERIMHECIEKLLRHDQFAEEEDIEALCKLMSTIGESIDHPKAKEYMDSYFELMLNLSNNIELSTRTRFMLKDVIDLRKNKWQERIKAEGPKKIEELHSDTAQEGQAVGNQLICSPRNFSSNKRASATFGSQPSNFRSPKKSERVAFRAMSSKNHGIESQDMRSDDRKHHQQGALTVPLQQDDNVTTVGLKRDFTKGMPLKEPTMFYSSPVANSHSGIQKSRKVLANTSGYSSIPELRPDNNLKQQLTPKHAPDIFMQAPVYSPSNQQGYCVNGGSTGADGSLGRSLMTRMIYPSVVSSGKGCSDEYFKEISVAVIQEFYSAGNENDIFNYVENLNSPNFNPSMISIWVKDSFQRNDKESDLLAGLLISLTKSRAGGLTTRQLIKGFELVLATLEVALTDAAKAAAFLGKLFGKIVTKNVISLKEIKRMVQQSGKVPGQSPESKLGYEVMKIALETIQLERGESGLKGMCKRFNVQLDDFHPSTTVKP